MATPSPATRRKGSPCDEAFVLGSDTMHREWGYAALSRGRHASRLYLVAGDPLTDDAQTRVRREPGDVLHRAVNHLGHSRAKHLAIDDPLP